jgi:hypothetical protein
MSEQPSIGVGMPGYAFMGKAHSRAFREGQQATDVRAYELVYHALGGE